MATHWSVGLVTSVLVTLSALAVMAQSSGPTPALIQGLPPPPAAAEAPPLCSKREHMGRLTFLVDQAWQIYRRLEQSSPQRVGWCACAKRCEPIDELAAEYEEIAFDAREASRDLGLPSDLREEYADLSDDMFRQRNDMVNTFRSCLDFTRPPIQSSSLSANSAPIPGYCEKSLPLAERWALWCKKFEDKWSEVHAIFRDKTQNLGDGQFKMAFPLMALPDGSFSINGQYTFTNNLPASVLKDIKKAVSAIKVDPFPKGTRYSAWLWEGSFEIIRFEGLEPRSWPGKMPCPKL